MKMAGSLHPPFRRKKFRSAPSPPNGEDYARSIPSSSPHKISDFAGAPIFFPKKKRKRAVHGPKEKKTFLRGTGARLERGRQVRMTVPTAWPEREFWRSWNGPLV